MPARRIRSRDVLLAFSPALARRSMWNARDPEETDDAVKGRGRAVRYLVALLPWLSLLDRFQPRPAQEKGKRLSEQSGWSERGEGSPVDEEARGASPRDSGHVWLTRKPVPNRQGNENDMPGQSWQEGV